MSSYKPKPLERGSYYHIYNRGNNGIDIFYDTESYYHFLRLYEKYIIPIADTFAWCLLKNHFHLLVYIKTDDEIDISKLEYSTVESPKVIDASKQFGHLFNAYTQAINKKFNRTGSLFEKPFERKLVKSEKYFQNLIFYIHNNPVFHRFTDHINNYPWSSYETIISDKPTKLKRDNVINIFESKEKFIDYHSQKQNFNEIIDLIIE
ncbi:transposase [Flavobacterium sp.]|uniref:transposase n=1 Tax=Flavobacterium sp. TaxID=239 RepID=UPI00375115F0